MKPLISVTTACISCLLGTVAAQETGTPEAQERQGIPASPHQEQAVREIESDLFARLDQDRSGSISKQEAQAESSLSEGWSGYDRNRDGMLDPTEFSAFEQSSTGAAETEDLELQRAGRTEADMPASPHQEQTIRDDLIEQLDKDGDGGISQQEAQGERRLAANWSRLDRNGDGKLDTRELDRFDQ